MKIETLKKALVIASILLGVTIYFVTKKTGIKRGDFVEEQYLPPITFTSSDSNGFSRTYVEPARYLLYQQVWYEDGTNGVEMVEVSPFRYQQYLKEGE